MSGRPLHHRVLATIGLVVVAALAWIWLPLLAAAGKALDHPAWADVTRDPGELRDDRTSWWPPGRRYVWEGHASGRLRTAIDPWAEVWHAHLWTAVVLVATAAVVSTVWFAPRRHVSA